MARIRDDLDGSVFLHASAGPVVLVAGDEVPEGFVVGAHLLADDEELTTEGGAADESGDTAPIEDSVPEVEPEPADDGVGAHLLADDEELTTEGGAADESGDTAPIEDSVPEVEPEPADDGEGTEPTPIPAKRAAAKAKA